MGILDVLFGNRPVESPGPTATSQDANRVERLAPDPQGMNALREKHRATMDGYSASRRRAQQLRVQEHEQLLKQQEERNQRRLVEEARRAQERASKLAGLQQQILQLVWQHRPQLVTRYRTCSRDDGYGNITRNGWTREVQYFIEKVLVRDLGTEVKSVDRLWLDAQITNIASTAADETGEVDDLTPREFELFCKGRLEVAGWSVNQTPVTGDQGVDLVARKGSNLVAVQCKLYASPVGNFAVQEVFAGMRFVGANKAVVVTNNRYTPQAEQLADSTGVLLLHVSQLDDFDRHLRT